VEYQIQVNRWGWVRIFAIRPNGYVHFACLAESIEWAVAYCRPFPTHVVVTSEEL
jgi:hypothetical protein